MRQLKLWALKGTSFGYDLSPSEAYEIGAKEMRERIVNLILEQDQLNSDNVKNNPNLAPYLLLELIHKVETLGEEEVD